MDGGRPFLPRAISVAETGPAKEGVRLDFLIEGIGPGTDRLCELEVGEGVWVTGPLGNAFSTRVRPATEAAGAILVGGGIGVAPLALLRRRFSERGVPLRVLLGFRNEQHCGGLELFCGNGGDSARGAPGHRGRPRGHRGYVTDLLAAMLAGDDAGSAVVYSCGPPAMLEAVRPLCDPSAASLPSWRWSPRWPAALAPASAARSRSPAAATCVSASTARSFPRVAPRRADARGSFSYRRAWGVPCGDRTRAEHLYRRLLRHRARPPGDQRLRDLRRDRRSQGLRRRSCWRTSPSRPSSRRRSPPSRGPATRRSGSGRPRRG